MYDFTDDYLTHAQAIGTPNSAVGRFKLTQSPRHRRTTCVDENKTKSSRNQDDNIMNRRY
jgi:hypothetical protein